MTNEREHTDVFHLHRGGTPVLVSVPHAGENLPSTLRARMASRAAMVEDTDWHLNGLYDFARTLGCSLLTAQHSRYVIDLNRPSDNAPMYPGANNTELCPTHFFTGDALYLPGMAPDTAEIDARRRSYWQPYHDALRGEMQRLHATHGHALLFDGHSIKAELPWLFEGRLPDLNLGTANGTSCDPSLRDALAAVLHNAQPLTHVVDGRFKGGFITRHYGRPAQGWHAVQLEMGWHLYADDTVVPPTLMDERVARLAPVLRELLATMLEWRPAR